MPAGRLRPPIPRARKLLPVPESQGPSIAAQHTPHSDNRAPRGPGSGRGAGPEPSLDPFCCRFHLGRATVELRLSLDALKPSAAREAGCGYHIGLGNRGSILHVARERRLMNARQFSQSADLKHHSLNCLPLGPRWTDKLTATRVSKHVQRQQQNNVTPPRQS